MPRRKTAKLRLGKRLYHGTQSPDEFVIPEGPAWFSDDKGVAEQFVDFHSWAKGEMRPRIMVYKVSTPPVLIRINNEEQLDDLLEQHGIDITSVSEADALTGLVGSGYDGWIIPDNYGEGKPDIMLLRPRYHLSPAGEVPVPEPARNPLFEEGCRYWVYHHFERPRPSEALEMETDDLDEAKEIADSFWGGEYAWGLVRDTHDTEPYPTIYDSSSDGIVRMLRESFIRLDTFLTGHPDLARQTARNQIDQKKLYDMVEGGFVYYLSDGGYSRIRIDHDRKLHLVDSRAVVEELWDRPEARTSRAEIERLLEVEYGRWESDNPAE